MKLCTKNKYDHTIRHQDYTLSLYGYYRFKNAAQQKGVTVFDQRCVLIPYWLMILLVQECMHHYAHHIK